MMESGRARARWLFGGALLLGVADMAFLNFRLAPEYEAIVLAEAAPTAVASNQGRAPPAATATPSPAATPTAVAQVDPPPQNTAPAVEPPATAPLPEPAMTAPPATAEPPAVTAPPVATAPPPPPPTTSGTLPSAAPDILFGFSKHELSYAAKKQLEEVARELKQNSALRVHIRGHSDKLGTPTLNLSLSEMRATVVKYYLTVIGVSEDRITIEALGDTEPADPEDNPVAWAKNRRVQIVWR